MDRTYIVYKHTAPTGECYIGITCQQPEHRWGKNGEGYLTQKKFADAILKYGWDNFTHEILFTGLTVDEACEKEIALIQEYDSIKNGFNTYSGGLCSESVIGVPVSQYTLNGEYIEDYSSVSSAASTLGITQGAISNVLCGNAFSAGGYIWAYPGEQPRIPNMQIVQYEKSQGFHHIGAQRTVLQFSMDGTLVGKYDSLYDAEIKTGFDKGRISEGCTKPYVISVYGFRWMYEDSPYEFHTRSRPIRKVICKENGIVYESSADAARNLGLDKSMIRKVCKGKYKSTKGFHFSYAPEEESNEQEELVS